MNCSWPRMPFRIGNSPCLSQLRHWRLRKRVRHCKKKKNMPKQISNLIFACQHWPLHTLQHGYIYEEAKSSTCICDESETSFAASKDDALSHLPSSTFCPRRVEGLLLPATGDGCCSPVESALTATCAAGTLTERPPPPLQSTGCRPARGQRPMPWSAPSAAHQACFPLMTCNGNLIWQRS